MPRSLSFAAACALGALCLARPLGAEARAWMPSIFGDHMVLQAGKPLVLWGRDCPGTELRASLRRPDPVESPPDFGELWQGPEPRLPQVGPVSLEGTTRCSQDGTWTLSLPAIPAGGPYELLVEGSVRHRFTDVLVGEVWLGSGQSNMEFQEQDERSAQEDLPGARDAGLRLFTVERGESPEPLEDLKGHWQVCTPDSAAHCSAVAFHFGRELRAALGLPVGMLTASWGGTPAEFWVPTAAAYADKGVAQALGPLDEDAAQSKAWRPQTQYWAEFSDLALYRSDGTFTQLPLDGWNRSVSGAASCQVEEQRGKAVFLGAVQEGSWALAGPKAAPLDLAPYKGVYFRARGQGDFDLLLGGKDFAAGDSASRPFTLTPSWVNALIPLAAMHPGGRNACFWPPASAEALGFRARGAPYPKVGGKLFNAMVAPLAKFPLRGVLWYQGEANVARAGAYRDLLRLLVGSWRAAWQQDDLEFLAVQLPGYADGGDRTGAAWPALRLAQKEAIESLPQAGLAVTLDLGEAGNIHPVDKKDVAHRLFLIALDELYGGQVEDSGPKAEGLTRQGRTLKVRFSHAEGLRLAAPGLGGFEVAGKDGVFKNAQVKLDQGALLAWSDAVPKPQALRYAWGNFPLVQIYNAAGLPGSPFLLELKKSR